MSESDDRQQTIDDFAQAVNMTAKQIEDWLERAESQAVG